MSHRLVRRPPRALVRCWLSLAPVMLLAGAPAAEQAGSTWVRVLAETDTGLELVLQAPEPEIAPDGIRLPGFAPVGEPGMPRVFEQAATLGVPGVHGAHLEILELHERDLGPVRAAILPVPVSAAERREAEAAGRPVEELRPAPARPLLGPYPERALELSGVARVRGRDVVALHFRPLQYRPDGSAVCVVGARVRVVFADRVRLRTRAPGLEPLHAGLLNAASAAAWELSPAAEPRKLPAAPTQLPAQRLRIRIERRGVYELTYADLKSAQVPVERSDFDPTTFRLFFDSWKPVPLFADSTPSSWQSGSQMQEAAIWIPGEGDGSFTHDDPNDRIVFYALGPEGYEDLAGTSADSLAYYRHPFDANLYAWLVWGDGSASAGGAGLRMSARSAAVPDTSTAPVVDRVWHREHREQDVSFDVIDDLWYWQEARPNRPVQVGFGLDLAGQAPASGDLRLALGYGEAAGHHVLSVGLNGQAVGTAAFYQSESRASLFRYTGVTLDSINQLVLGVQRPQDTSRGTYLLEFDLAWQRPLVADHDSVLGWSARPQAPGAEVYALSGFGSRAPLVLDVTDPLRPERLTDLTPAGSGTTTVWRAQHGRGPGQRLHCLAVASPTDVVARNLSLRTVAPLGARSTAPDMLIVTHERLRSAALRLAAHRRAHYPEVANPEILVTTTQDIYDNFSGGRLDPLAIRNYAKFLYRLDAEPRLGFVLLLGDGTRDLRQLQASSQQTLVPTLEPGYLDARLNRLQTAYAVDDWLGEFDTPRNSDPPYAVPDVALGRLTARSLADAERMVDKIVAYETSSGFGTWRARVLLAADDECHPGYCGEVYHIDNTEDLAKLVPRDLEVVKFYLTEYPATQGQKPQARSAFIRTWSEGCGVLNYQGHGAPRQLADEVLFLSTDIPALANGARLPLFLPISCTVSEFDDPERQSMCEDLLTSPGGGAIATIGATTATYVNYNFPLNAALFQQLFASGATTHRPLGVILQVVKQQAPIGNGQFNEPYVLLADPALQLVLPQALVRFTAGADTLATGQRAQVVGEVYAPGNSSRLTGFEGQAEVEVLGTDDTSGYRRPPPDLLYIAYNLPGAPIYRGTVPVHAGRLDFQFIVPLGARSGARARIWAYATSTGAGALDARGEREDVSVRVAAPQDSSLGPPRITLRFPNQLTHVKAGTVLTAEIRDENGINIQGTSLRNSIYLDFDRRNEPLNVTGQFRYTQGSDSVGSVSVPLPADLDPGPHAATVIASDNLLDTGTASLDFQVVGETAVQLVNVIAFPNPFRDWTRFFFEITDPAEVELQVFTPSGRQVWHTRSHHAAAKQGSIKWDGVDLAEDTLANGTYLYRLRARPDRAGAPTLEHIGKIVIMR